MAPRLVAVALFVLQLAAVAVDRSAGQQQYLCAGVGYYPYPGDCSRFYRCTDIFANGVFQQFEFECAAGTVFDDNLDVCNWPWAVPACGKPNPLPIVTSTQPPMTPPTTTTAQPTIPSVETTTAGQSYIPSPGSAYQCQKPGVFKYEPDCQKFWLCKEMPAGTYILESLLYRCPEGYLFSSSTLRCAKSDDAVCISGQPELRAYPVIQLSVSELDSFFARWG